MTSESTLLLEAVNEVARLAGAKALSYFGKSPTVETKSDGSPVTIADRSAEEVARAWISTRFPNDGIRGEELGQSDVRARRTWIIDPIDGTKSFVHGVPLWGTLSNAAIGFAIGVALGLVIGSLMAEVPAIERLVMPYAFALQSLPKVAIAPLVVIWFGFGDGSKIAISALLSFFPVLINSFTGLRAVEPERLDLMRSLSATRFETYRIVKLPNAAPFIFAGLDMAVVYALLGAIVAEFLGAQRGMGVVITQAQAVSDVAGVFAALVILGMLGILLHAIVRWAEARIVHWGANRNK